MERQNRLPIFAAKLYLLGFIEIESENKDLGHRSDTSKEFGIIEFSMRLTSFNDIRPVWSPLHSADRVGRNEMGYLYPAEGFYSTIVF